MPGKTKKNRHFIFYLYNYYLFMMNRAMAKILTHTRMIIIRGM